MVAGAIHMCGAFGGVMSGPTRNNRAGMFENARIRNTLVKPYLDRRGVDRLGQYPLPDIQHLSIPIDLRARVIKVMLDQGYTQGPWFYKGAKMCLVWPVWHYAFPDAKWVIVRRNTDDIVDSCLRTSFMRAFTRPENRKAVGAKSERDGWLWWVKQHETRFVEMITTGLDVKVVWPERMVQGDYRQAVEVIKWCGLEWNSDVLGFIDPKLWHSRRKADVKGRVPLPQTPQLGRAVTNGIPDHG